MQYWMGTWGPGIFSDDEAADARTAWRRAVLDGADLGAAVDGIVREYRDAQPGLTQDAYAANVWIALAAAQFETGRLSDHVRDRALGFLAHGGDLDRWDGRTVARARVLERWTTKLRGKQPAPKHIRPPQRHAVRFDVGDVVRLRDADSDAEGLFHVAAVFEDGDVPLVEHLAWDGGALPDTGGLATLPPLHEPGQPAEIERHRVYTARRADAFGPHLGAVVARGVRRPPLHENSRKRYASWPALVRMLGAPVRREALALAREPARLARRQAESARRDAEMRLAIYDRVVARFEERDRGTRPQDVANWTTAMTARAVHLAPEDRARFDELVRRARRLGGLQ